MAKKEKKKMFVINPYGWSVILTTSVKQFNKVCKKHKVNGLEDKADVGGALQSVNEKLIFIIGVFCNDLGVLVHELNHLCIRLFEFLDTPINDDSSETYCYLNQYLFNEFRVLFKMP